MNAQLTAKQLTAQKRAWTGRMAHRGHKLWFEIVPYFTLLTHLIFPTSAGRRGLRQPLIELRGMKFAENSTEPPRKGRPRRPQSGTGRGHLIRGNDKPIRQDKGPTHA